MSSRFEILMLACALSLASTSWGQGFAPTEAEGHVTALDGVRVKLFASEPDVRQAIFVKCDDRGRVWTIQYLQYPNPAGLQRVTVDRWSRTVYDRIPEPPPRGPQGADRITILTDVDGDGRADAAKDFIDGLNLVTGVEFGHGGVYVLQAPYLLFYPDKDRDDVPDGDPEVLLTGFGMEDAQAMANHLTWGPDGWLYGVNGSTTTCRINGLEFQQGCWRYHPLTKEFELFCEGGLNCYGLTFDANGELFYSTNGGPFVHAVQGGYFYKSFGKHGPLHNLFAYHFFPQQECDQAPNPGGPPTGGTIYNRGALPSKLTGAFVAGNFLGHTVSWWNLTPNGSTVRASYGGELINTHDSWSGPTDFCVGPDGSAYVSDFFDQRTAHPDPDANWDRSNGRIYRIEAIDAAPAEPCDVAALSSPQLVELLKSPNRWKVDRARVELATRRDKSVASQLEEFARQSEDAQLALDGLWALNAVGSLDGALAAELVAHPAEYVRFWAIRLLGDRRDLRPSEFDAMQQAAMTEESPRVLAQLAASAKRLPGAQCLAIVDQLLQRSAGVDDPRVPWLIWWAIESKAMSDIPQLLKMCGSDEAWTSAPRSANSLRLLRRWAADGSAAGYEACDQLLATTPADRQDSAYDAIRQGLSERAKGYEEITQGGLYDQQALPGGEETPRQTRQYEQVSGPLYDRLLNLRRMHPDDDSLLEIALRLGDDQAYADLRQKVEASATPLDPQQIALLREFGREDLIPLLLPMVSPATSPQQLEGALALLAGFDSPEITRQLLAAYDVLPTDARRHVREALFARPSSAEEFLLFVDGQRIPTADVALEELRSLALHRSEAIDALVRKHWGNVGPGSSEEKLSTMRRFSNDLRAAAGDPHAGKPLFAKHCGVCHQLHGEGEKIGPDLTAANRQDLAALLGNIVDPSAVIRREYVNHVIITSSGQVVGGILAEQTGAGVTVLTAENKRINIANDEIEEMAEAETSLMPERILEALTPQERRDLFSYLQQP
ncbi:MAG: dehydrogenase [Pirellula sp.]|nr:dehydrogenase [Pirellula sp.]